MRMGNMGKMTTRTQPQSHASMRRRRPPAPGETLVPRGFEEVGGGGVYLFQCSYVLVYLPPFLTTSPPFPHSRSVMDSLLRITNSNPSSSSPRWPIPSFSSCVARPRQTSALSR